MTQTPSLLRHRLGTPALVALALSALAATTCGGEDPTAPPPGAAGAAGDSAGGSGGTAHAGGGGSGGDAGTELPCDHNPLGDDDVVAAPGSYALGDFSLAVSAEGTFVASAGGSEVFAAAARPIEIGRVAVTVEDHQGSFSIQETVAEACSAQRLDRVLYGGEPGAEVVVLQGTFSDTAGSCAATSFELRFCQAGPGQLAFRFDTDDAGYNRLSLRTPCSSEERIYGLGEQFRRDTLNLNGRRIPIVAQEGGIGRGHAVISPAVNAFSEGSAGSEDSTYYAAPHYLTSAMHSLALENEEAAIFDFTGADQTEIHVFAPTMRGRFFQGDDPLSLISRFTDFAGRMQEPPSWLDEGAIVALARPLTESEQIVTDLLAAGAEIAAVWNQTWSGTTVTSLGEQVTWNWILDEGHAAAWHPWRNSLESLGIRTLCYVNPMLRDVSDVTPAPARNLYQEAIAGGYLVQHPDGGPYLLEVTAFDVGLVDLSNDAARDWLRAVLVDEMLEGAGCSGWMADFAEALPFDAVLASGEPAAAWHNRYPVEWARLHRQAVEDADRLGDVLVFHRSGHTRSPRHALMFWQGDQLTTWDKYDGLVSALHGLINGGFSGMALNHSDTGGYTSLSWLGLGYDREAELLKRWTEMSAFTALLRTHEGNQPEYNAQIYSDAEARQHFARFSKIYRALGFYRRTLYAEAAQRGWPVVRHLWLHYPDDPLVHDVDDQFLLGSEILVAPIKNKCWTYPICPYDKETYFPPGEWVHLWSGTLFGDPNQGVTDSVQAPIGEPAVFYRRGSAVGATFVANLDAAGIAVPAPP